MGLLIIAEKPSMAQEIAKNLRENAKIEKLNGYYKIGDDVVTWLYGHILEMFMPEDYDADYKYWRFDALPIVPEVWKNKVAEGCKAQFQVVKGLLAKAETIVHAGDPDREGQLLVDEVLEYIGIKAPVKRLLLNALDAKSVKAALHDLRDNENFAGLRVSAQLRQRMDWLVGMNCSRAYTLAARRKGYDGVYPVGRVQTPTLALVVRREEEIKHFVPVTHYGVTGLFRTKRATPEKEESFQMTWKAREDSKGLDSEGRLVDVIAMRDILERVNNGDRQGKVIKYEVKPCVEKQRKPFSLSTLQIAAGRLYGMEPKEVLDVCQKLYEKKFTTYPRSDCEYLPTSQRSAAAVILHNLKLTGNEDLAAFAGAADERITSPAWDDGKITAHHAIIPTEIVCNMDTLPEEERKIYFLIARAYIAQFLPVHRYDQTKVQVCCANEIFVVSGKTVTSTVDWKIVYRQAPEEEKKDEEEKLLPLLCEGEVLTLMRATQTEKKTTPPKRFSPSSLVQAMKEIHKYVFDKGLQKTLKSVTGIGTEATRAQIIEELQKRGLLVKEKKNVIPSEKAKQLVGMLPRALTYPDYTAQMEDGLERVASGTIASRELFDRQLLAIKDLCAMAATVELAVASQAVKCPQCGKGVLQLRKGKKGVFWGCSYYPECKASYPDAAGKPDMTERPQSQREKFGCPVCGKGELFYNKKFDFWGCSNYKNGCTGAFSSDGEGKPMLAPCSCGAYLRKLKGKRGEFWACRECKKTYENRNGKPYMKA